MIIRTLSLRNFRNYAKQDIEFDPGINILAGNNGQGKTNVIEAIVYLSQGRSFRIHEDKHLIQDGESFASILGQYSKDKQSLEIKAVLRKEGKFLKVNSTVCSKLSQFVGQSNVVLFNPNDMNYFEGSPQLRRRNLDMDIGKNDFHYLESLSNYHTILKQRNAMLKLEHVDQTMLMILTEQLIQSQLSIITKRRSFLLGIIDSLNDYFNRISQSSSRISIEYQGPLNENSYQHDIEKQLTEVYAASLNKDLLMRSTNNGIHRDDIVYKMNDKLISLTASQGQKRLLLLAYKLALIDYVYTKTNDFPILCLDDIFSELDVEKIHQLFRCIDEKIQMIITTTDIHQIEIERSYSLFEVNDGILRKKEI